MFICAGIQVVEIRYNFKPPVENRENNYKN